MDPSAGPVLFGAPSEHEGRGYVQSDDVVNAGFLQGEESFCARAGRCTTNGCRWTTTRRGYYASDPGSSSEESVRAECDAHYRRWKPSMTRAAAPPISSAAPDVGSTTPRSSFRFGQIWRPATAQRRGESVARGVASLGAVLPNSVCISGLYSQLCKALSSVLISNISSSQQRFASRATQDHRRVNDAGLRNAFRQKKFSRAGTRTQYLLRAV